MVVSPSEARAGSPAAGRPPDLVAAAPVHHRQEVGAVPDRERVRGRDPVVQVGGPADRGGDVEVGGQAAEGRSLAHPQRRLGVVGRAGDVGADEAEPAAVGRPGRLLGEPGQRHELLRPAAADGHLVDARLGVQVGVGLEDRRERDPLAGRMPGGMRDVEVAGRQLARPRTGPGRDEEQVLAPVACAGVVLPVGGADDARDVLLRVARPESHLLARRHERDRAAVGRPVRRAGRAVGRLAHALRLPAVGIDQEELGVGIVVLARAGPVGQERDRAPVGRPGGGRVAPAPVREPPRPAAAVGDEPQVHLIAVAGDGAAGVDDPLAVGRDRRRADHDLAADDVCSERWHERGL